MKNTSEVEGNGVKLDEVDSIDKSLENISEMISSEKEKLRKTYDELDKYGCLKEEKAAFKKLFIVGGFLGGCMGIMSSSYLIIIVSFVLSALLQGFNICKRGTDKSIEMTLKNLEEKKETVYSNLDSYNEKYKSLMAEKQEKLRPKDCFTPDELEKLNELIRYFSCHIQQESEEASKSRIKRRPSYHRW